MTDFTDKNQYNANRHWCVIPHVLFYALKRLLWNSETLINQRWRATFIKHIIISNSRFVAAAWLNMLLIIDVAVRSFPVGSSHRHLRIRSNSQCHWWHRSPRKICVLKLMVRLCGFVRIDGVLSSSRMYCHQVGLTGDAYSL